jgi:hypothetical protein
MLISQARLVAYLEARQRDSRAMRDAMTRDKDYWHGEMTGLQIALNVARHPESYGVTGDK